MGIIGMYTADLKTLNQLSGYGSTTSISNTYARTGNYSFRCQSNSGYINIPSNTISNFIYFKVAILAQCYNIGVSSYGTLFLFDSEKNIVASVRLYDSNISIYSGSSSTLIGSASITGLYKWNIFEIYYLIADLNGRCTVKLDGITIIDFTGDTRINASIVSNFGSLQLSTTSATATIDYIYFDDIVIRDDTWPGRGGVYVLTPNAGSTIENWTASSGNPEDCVDELPPSGVDYIYTSTTSSGVQHLFGLSDMSANSGMIISGVGVVSYQKATSSSNAGVKTLIYPSGAAAPTASSGVGVDVSYAWTSSYYDKNPYTSGNWTLDDINSLQIGIEASPI